MKTRIKPCIAMLFLLLVSATAISAVQKRGPIVYAIEEGNLYSMQLIGPGNADHFIGKLDRNGKAEASFILDANSASILFTRNNSGESSSSVWILDKKSRETRKIVNGSSMARLSPDGRQIVATTAANNEVSLYAADGTYIRKVGIHGGSAAFSPDGRHIAYMKLSDSAADLDPGSPGMFIGIAIFDIITGREKIIFPALDGEFGVAGWSYDGKRLYYLASSMVQPEGWKVAMRSIGISGTDEREELNPASSEAPPFNSRTLWFPKDALVVSEGADEIWLYRLDKESHITSSTLLARGDTLQLSGSESAFAFRTSGKNSEWVVLRSSDLNRKAE